MKESIDYKAEVKKIHPEAFVLKPDYQKHFDVYTDSKTWATIVRNVTKKTAWELAYNKLKLKTIITPAL